MRVLQITHEGIKTLEPEKVPVPNVHGIELSEDEIEMAHEMGIEDYIENL